MLNPKQFIVKEQLTNQPSIIQQKFSSSNLSKYHRNDYQKENKLNQCQKNSQQKQKKVSLGFEQVRTTDLQSDEFYQIMDLIDEYDQKIKQINDLYSHGMIGLAQVKFHNPFTSLSTKGYRPTPAIVKVQKNVQICQKIHNQQEKYEILSLVQQNLDNVSFTLSVQKQLKDKQNDKQNTNSTDSSKQLKKNIDFYSQEQLLQEQNQTKQQCNNIYKKVNGNKCQFILQRFNILNPNQLINDTSKNFNQLLMKIFELNHFKKTKIQSLFEKIQKEKQHMRLHKEQY